MTIETDRLLLRPFKTEDAADVYEYLKEPSVNCFACMKLHSMSEAEAEMKSRMSDKDFYFAIVIKETEKVIGELFGHPEGTGPEDETMNTFSPCWMLNERFQGKGYAYEAARACAGKACSRSLYRL